MRETVRVAFVGGGRSAAPLLEDLLRRKFVDVIGIADLDPASPGALIADANGIFFTCDPLVFATRGDEIDVIVEVTGDPAIKRRLKRALADEGNRHTIIVHDLIARMMLSMSQDSDELMRTYHPSDTGVGN